VVVVPVTETSGTALPFVQGLSRVDSRAAAYVCRDFTCLAPVTSPEALRAALG
jgi:uncharacterized protein YyaL (SSP411 family)